MKYPLVSIVWNTCLPVVVCRGDMSRRCRGMICASVILVVLTACGMGENPTPAGGGEPAGLTVNGRVVDAAGGPLAGARVAVARAGKLGSVSVTEVDETGSFMITVPAGGFYEVRFQAIQKNHLATPFFVESNGNDIEVLDACLDDFSFAQEPARVWAIGSFNDFGRLNFRYLEERGDGSWATEIESELDVIEYQLGGLSSVGHVFYHGNQDELHYRSDHGWVGVAPVVDGRARIVVTVGPPPGRKCEQSFVFANLESPNAIFAQAVSDLRASYRLSMTRSRDLTDPKNQKKAFWEEFTREEFNPLFLQKLEQVETPGHKEYFAALYWKLLMISPADADTAAAERSYDLLTPTSETFVAVKGSAESLIYWGGQVWPERTRTFFDELVDRHDDAELRSSILHIQITEAKLAGNDERASSLMARLFAEYPESFAATMVRQRWGDLSPIPIGSPAPDFVIASLADPEKTISRADLEGGPYLIDFWATWCGPCIKEMPYLHKAYEKYADRGLKILSVSMDEDRSKAEAFVGAKFEMPWLNAIDTEGTKGEIGTAYGVQGIPAPVLVNSDGIIVAKSFELFGDNLEKQLEELFAGRGEGG